MNLRFVLAAAFALGIFCCGEPAAWAQRPAHYYPTRPVFSPYFAYSAINTTGLPNYYTYIRPARQFEAFLDREQAAGARFDDRIRLDEQRIGEILERQLTIRQTTGAGAPALPGSYQTYSHFFPSMNSGRRR